MFQKKENDCTSFLPVELCVLLDIGSRNGSEWGKNWAILERHEIKLLRYFSLIYHRCIYYTHVALYLLSSMPTTPCWVYKIDMLPLLFTGLMLVLVIQSCPTLCDPMDCSPQGSSVHEILQARIVEWVAMPFSRGSF